MSATSDGQAHWDAVYATKSAAQLSWYQLAPEPSLSWILDLKLPADTRCIDVGGGVSTLTDRLLDRGFRALEVLDISPLAVAQCQARLGEQAHRVRWHAGSVLDFAGGCDFGLWHDRAVLHFINLPADQRRYRTVVRQSVAPGGYVLLAPFASDGPHQCSSLPVTRYSVNALEALLGDEFTLERSQRVLHHTPWNSEQAFQFALFRRSD